MIDKQQTAIFKSNQDFNKNKQKIFQYIKYAENWQVASVICSYTAMACDVLLILFPCYNLTYSGPYNATKLGVATFHLVLYDWYGNQQIYLLVLPMVTKI